jgi:hypothetical protein
VNPTHAPSLPRRGLLRAAVAVAAVSLAGCAAVSHVTKGDVTLRDRLVVTVDQPWNQFERGLGDNTPTWTQDGITVDALRFYPGLKDGELLAPTPTQDKGAKPLAFKSAMSPREVVALFEALHARDGAFTLTRVAPEPFVGTNGMRFEFTLVRQVDEVTLQGVGWLAVKDGALYAITFAAPRLAFFPRHAKLAEALARTARVKG